MAMWQRQYGAITTAVPEEWQDNSIINLAGEPRDGYRPNVVFALREFKEDPSLKAYAEYQLKTLKDSQLEGLKVIGEGLVKVGEREIYRLATGCDYPVPQEGELRNVRLRQDQYYIVQKKQVLTVTLTCRAEDYQDLQPVFDEIVAGTALEEPAPATARADN